MGAIIHQILLWLANKLAKLVKPKVVLAVGEVSAKELEDLLRAKFPTAFIYLADNFYRLPIKEDVERFLAEDLTNLTPYEAETYDCDDFSFRLMGQFSSPGWSDIAFGIVWTDLHALNFIIDWNKEFWFIEPQQDRLLKEPEPWQGSHVRLLIV